MSIMDINPDSYVNNLEDFLQRLRKEIESIVQPYCENHQNLSELDHYIYEINSFYYKSFHENFFPAYRNGIQQEVSTLLKLSRKEDMIKKDILASIKRYAKLYNQVKNISSFLTDFRDNSNQQIFNLYRDRNHRNLELLYALRKLQDNLKLLNEFTNNVNRMLEDKELLDGINIFPEHSITLKIISSLDINDPLTSDSLNNLLIYLHDIKNLLVRLQVNKQDFRHLIDEIFMNIDDPFLSFSGSTSTILKTFCEKNVYRQFHMYRELISLNMVADNRPRVIKLAQEFEKWLSNLLIVFTKGMEYITRQQGQLLYSTSLISTLAPGFLQNLSHNVVNTLKSVEILINELSNTEESDFEYSSNKTLEILEDAYPRFKKAITEKTVTCTGPLFSLINQVNMELSFLKIKIDLFNKNHEHSSKMLKKYLGIIKVLDSHLELLGNVKADLQRLLAPRNISRTWKDLIIRIERIPLEKGKLFPGEYQYLLDKYAIETRITKHESHLVLHEEGDIFIIRVDDEVEEEIPYIVISQKG